MQKSVLSFVIILILCSCGDQKIDTTKAREEMEAREIKVVSDAQIQEAAMNLGEKLSADFKVEKVNNEWSFDLGKDSSYDIKYYLFEENHELEGKALMIYEAYEYNVENGLSSEPNVQKVENGTRLLYTKPMIFEGSTFGMWAIEFSRKQIVLSINN